MIRIETLSGEYLNNFPTIRAAAIYCLGTEQLWQYSFIDEVKWRRISYVVIEKEIEKLKKEKNRA